MFVKEVMRMRKLAALLAALVFLLCTLPAHGDFDSTLTPLPGYTLRPSFEEVRVYATRSMKANIAGYLIPGGSQEIQVLEVSGDWCFISFTSVSGVSYGYVPLAYFDYTPEPTPTPAPDSPVIYKGGTSGWIINQQEGYRLNLREDPSATAKSIGKYFTGTPLIFTGNQKNSFVQVLLAGTTFGWVDERFVTSDALSFVPETPTVTIKNSGSGAVLRSGPSSSYDRIGWFSHGTPVVVLGVHADGWHHVDVNGQVGYISPSLLSGIFPYGNGLDSDNITHNSETTNSILNLYINTRSSGGQLHLRKSASVSAKSLGLFYTGTPVTVLSYTRDGWAYVRIGQSEGYMDADYLASLKPTQYGAQRTVRNSRATGLNLRSLPSTGGELLSFAPNYASITVLGELTDGWCYVEYNGQLGYMLGTYLK